MTDYFDQQDDFDYEQELLSLVADFTKKVQNNEPSMFYDMDDWLDIIDYFLAEESDDILLKIALDKADETYPDNVEITVRKAEYLSQTEPEEAYTILSNAKKKACCRDEREASLFDYQKAKVLIRMNRCDEAMQLLEGMNLAFENEYIFEKMAEIAIRRKQFKEAERFVLLALNIDKNHLNDDDVTAYGAGDFLFLNTVLSDNLLTVAAELCRLHPASKESVFETMEYFVRENPFSCDYWETLAEFHVRARDYDKAAQAYDYCRCIAPHDLDIQRKILQIHIKNLDKEKTCRLIDKLIPEIETEMKRVQDRKLRIGLSEFWKACLREYFETAIYLKWYDKCLAMCEDVLEKNKTMPICDGDSFYSKGEIRMFMARCLLSKGETNKALHSAMQVIKEEPEYYGHRITFAELLYDCGDSVQADEIYQSMYEQCCEQAVKTQFKDNEERETAEFFKKHRSYVAASWAMKMAENNKGNEALSLISEVFDAMDKDTENDLFVLECALIDILLCGYGSEENIYTILEDMILHRDYTAEAIVHRIPSLTENEACVRKLKELTKKSEEND